jgi:CubicO group peptidase (beta-lactamase class C family)
VAAGEACLHLGGLLALVLIAGPPAAALASPADARGIHFPPPGEALANQDRRPPVAVGLKPDIIPQLRAHVRTGRWALWRNGRLVRVEGDFNARTEVKSLRKTWHALAVGAAIGQGKIPSLDRKLSEWNKELTGKDAEAPRQHVIRCQ